MILTERFIDGQARRRSFGKVLTDNCRSEKRVYMKLLKRIIAGHDSEMVEK
jgi:hypothetical protein